MGFRGRNQSLVSSIVTVKRKYRGGGQREDVYVHWDVFTPDRRQRKKQDYKLRSLEREMVLSFQKKSSSLKDESKFSLCYTFVFTTQIVRLLRQSLFYNGRVFRVGLRTHPILQEKYPWRRWRNILTGVKTLVTKSTMVC